MKKEMLKFSDYSLTSKYPSSIGPQQNDESSHWLQQASAGAMSESAVSVHWPVSFASAALKFCDAEIRL